MNTLYCHCGARNEYRGLKPKFCSSCGDALDSTAAFKRAATVVEGEEENEQQESRAYTGDLRMEGISVEIEGGSEVTSNGQVGVKQIRRITQRDFRGSASSIASMAKQV